jgi:hypothetical protein
MLNPFSKHKASRTIEITTGDGSDESPISSPDAAGYIGKNSLP